MIVLIKSYIGIEVQFDGSCLKQEKEALTHKQIVNIYIHYVIDSSSYKQVLILR